MKYLYTFENFNEEDRSKYDNLNSNKEDMENSSSFDELPEKEKEILSDAYEKESDNISSN